MTQLDFVWMQCGGKSNVLIFKKHSREGKQKQHVLRNISREEKNPFLSVLESSLGDLGSGAQESTFCQLLLQHAAR